MNIDFIDGNGFYDGVLESEDFSIPFRYKKGKLDSIVVGFDGWDPGGNYSAKPSYNSWKNILQYGYSALYFSHPVYKGVRISHSLYHAMLSSWKKEDLIEKFLSQVFSKIDLQIVFYGKSSGCFSALGYAAKTRSSKAFLINPELVSLNHSELSIAKVRSRLDQLFPQKKFLDLSSVNILNVLVETSYFPPTYILQNKSDQEYRESQLEILDELSDHWGSRSADSRYIKEYYLGLEGHSCNVSDIDFGYFIGALNRKPAYVVEDYGLSDSRLIYKKINFVSVVRILLRNFSSEGKAVKLIFDKGRHEENSREIVISASSKEIVEVDVTELVNGIWIEEANSGEGLDSVKVRVSEYVLRHELIAG